MNLFLLETTTNVNDELTKSVLDSVSSGMGTLAKSLIGLMLLAFIVEVIITIFKIATRKLKRKTDEKLKELEEKSKLDCEQISQSDFLKKREKMY